MNSRRSCIDCGVRCHSEATRCDVCAASDRAKASWVTRRANLEARFWEKVDQAGGPAACWPWTGATNGGGYGKTRRGGRVIGAHRRALELSVGRELATQEYACHHCDNPICCNPAHLFVGSLAENMADKIAKGRQARGETNGRAKLTRDQVFALRDLAYFGVSTTELSRLFAISPQHVQAIVSRRFWSAA